VLVAHSEVHTSCRLDPHRYRYLKPLQDSCTPRVVAMCTSELALLEGENGEVIVPFSTRACTHRCGAPLMEASYGFENLRVMFSASASPLRPRPRAGTRRRQGGELRPGTHIWHREWVRRNGRLGDIHSIDDRYDHDIDELMA
jgi:hypothetical protein